MRPRTASVLVWLLSSPTLTSPAPRFSSNTPSAFPPQDLGTCCPLCPKCLPHESRATSFRTQLTRPLGEAFAGPSEGNSPCPISLVAFDPGTLFTYSQHLALSAITQVCSLAYCTVRPPWKCQLSVVFTTSRWTSECPELAALGWVYNRRLRHGLAIDPSRETQSKVPDGSTRGPSRPIRTCPLVRCQAWASWAGTRVPLGTVKEDAGRGGLTLSPFAFRPISRPALLDSVPRGLSPAGCVSRPVGVLRGF